MPRSSFSARGALFRRRIKKKRIETNLRQEDVAARLNRPQSFVAKYESGERRLDVIEFIEVAEAIGFDPVEFIIELTSSDDEAHAADALGESGADQRADASPRTVAASERCPATARDADVFGRR